MPLFVWGIYATAIIQILATPGSRRSRCAAADGARVQHRHLRPELGGDPVLFQHFFWFYSHPAVYIMILPGMGDHQRADLGLLAQDDLRLQRHRVFERRNRADRASWSGAITCSSAARASLANAIFSFLTFLVAIPSGVKVFNWIATMYKGSIRLATPMLYALSFLFLFAIGGLTGLFLGALAMDVHLHDTYFVVAHFHYVMMGGTVMAFLGGLHYWWPKMFGRMYSEMWARVRVRADLHRLQHDVLHAVRPGQPRHAAPLLQLPGPVPAAARFLDRRFVGPGARVVHHGGLPVGVAAEAVERRRIPGAATGSNGRPRRRRPSTISSTSPIVTHGPYDYSQPVDEPEEVGA